MDERTLARGARALVNRLRSWGAKRDIQMKTFEEMDSEDQQQAMEAVRAVMAAMERRHG